MGGGAAHLICVQSSRSKVGCALEGGGGWERSSGGGHRVTHVIVARNGVSNAMSSRSGWRNDENNASNATASVQPSIEIRVSRWRLTPVEQISAVFVLWIESWS